MRLKDLREDMDLTQTQVARILNIKQNTYSQYENCQRQIPLDALITLAQFYKTSTDYILGLTNVRKPYPRAKNT
ncbi:MAG: helix-turn-helix transcriptional regulator [Lachnospiraceae bacterium]|nr:helix-turn-helix transcriptional regulator [Lachnospiraceae bacterium]